MNYPQMLEKMRKGNVPVDETPEELIREIDPRLKYTGEQLGVGYSVSNRLYVVRDVDGLEKVLKVASAPANIFNAHHEHDILRKLSDLRGIPRVFRFYNPNSGGVYNPEKFTAMLREYVEAEEFNQALRGKEVYDRLHGLALTMNSNGVTLPRDFNSRNVRVDKTGQPYILDLEESTQSSQPVYDSTANHAKLRKLFISNVKAHLSRSRNPVKKILSRSDAIDLIASLFYEGPVKSTGW